MIKYGFLELHFSTKAAVGLIKFDKDVFSLDFPRVDQGHDFCFKIADKIAFFVVTRKQDVMQYTAIWQKGHGIFRRLSNGILGI